MVSMYLHRFKPSNFPTFLLIQPFFHISHQFLNLRTQHLRPQYFCTEFIYQQFLLRYLIHIQSWLPLFSIPLFLYISLESGLKTLHIQIQSIRLSRTALEYQPCLQQTTNRTRIPLTISQLCSLSLSLPHFLLVG